MSIHKDASSQAAWALLTEGVTKARLELHRLQHLINRATKLVEGSEEKEHIYQVAGDILSAVPDRMDKLGIALDRTSLALARMGEEFLKSRLPLSEKMMVDEAVEAAFGTGMNRSSDAVERIARRYLERDTE